MCMKKTLTVLLLVMVAFSLSAAELVNVDLSELDTEEKMAYMFLYGYEAVLEELCKGCFLAIDEDFEYIGGWRTSRTPEDFAVNVPAGTITTVEVLPRGLATVMFQLLKDNETAAKLTGIRGDGLYVVCMFLPEDDMVLAEPSFNYGQRLLEDELARHGVNPSDFYSFMAGQTDSETGNPITLESMVYTMYSGAATAREIVLDGMGRMEAAKQTGHGISSYSDIIAYALLVTVGVLVVIVLVYSIHESLSRKRLRKADAQAEMDKHNEESL